MKDIFKNRLNEIRDWVLIALVFYFLCTIMYNTYFSITSNTYFYRTGFLISVLFALSELISKAKLQLLAKGAFYVLFSILFFYGILFGIISQITAWPILVLLWIMLSLVVALECFLVIINERPPSRIEIANDKLAELADDLTDENPPCGGRSKGFTVLDLLVTLVLLFVLGTAIFNFTTRTGRSQAITIEHEVSEAPPDVEPINLNFVASYDFVSGDKKLTLSIAKRSGPVVWIDTRSNDGEKRTFEAFSTNEMIRIEDIFLMVDSCDRINVWAPSHWVVTKAPIECIE